MESDQQKFKNILIIVGGILIFYFVFEIKVLLYIATVISVLCALIPVVATGVNWFWMKLATVLGWINTRILLSVVFYIFLFPIAALSRLFSRDPLQLKKRNISLYTERNHEYNPQDLENIW